MKHWSVSRAVALAAVIGLVAMLVGCGIAYVLKMQDLIIGEGEPRTETQSRHALTFSGLRGTSNYQAAREWLEFNQSFDSDGEILRAAWANPVDLPAEYDAYNLYSQEQAEKLAALAENYGLKLAGPQVKARTPRSLLAYLNMESFLVPGAEGTLSNMVAKYYEQGMLYADFYLLMEAEGAWPHDTLCLYYYTPKTCFDDRVVYLHEAADWREWNYTTASGDLVLILRSDAQEEAYIFRDHENATTTLKIYTSDLGESMTDQQLQQMVDQINLSANPQPEDPEYLKGFGGGIDQSQQTQTRNGYTIAVKSVMTDGEITYVTLGLTAPESVNLEACEIAPGNRGEGLMLPKDSRKDLPRLFVNWNVQQDGDGQAHTQDLLLVADSQTMDASGFLAGEGWDIYIEGLDLMQPGSMMQSDLCQQIDGVWQFDITIGTEAVRTVEFVEAPLAVTVQAGNGPEETAVTSLILRQYSASLTFEGLAGSLDDYENDKQICAVLRDGSTIALYHTGGPGLVTRLQPETEIPLDQVDHLLLPDGRTLLPVS